MSIPKNIPDLPGPDDSETCRFCGGPVDLFGRCADCIAEMAVDNQD